MNEKAEQKASFTGKGEERVSVKWEDGSSYEGDLLDGKFHGQGVYVWPNGDKFSGIWKNGKKDGNGCFSRPNGFVFIGLFSDDVPNGKGFYIGPDGTTFSGNWKGGEQNGHGILRDNDESIIYYGPWKNGAPTSFIS